MNEHLELALRKMNEALAHLDDYKVESGYDDTYDDTVLTLEDAIEPLSDLWQETH